MLLWTTHSDEEADTEYIITTKPTKFEHRPKSPREERTTSKWSQVLQRYSFASSPDDDDDDDDDDEKEMKDGNDGDDILVVRVFCWMTLPI